MMAALLLGILAMIALVLALWPVLKATGWVAQSEFSTVFQSAIRWNGFMAFAITEKIFPPEGLAVVALVMAAIIIPINLSSVFVVTRFAAREADWRTVIVRILTNPLMMASLAAVVLRLMPFGLYEPLNETFKLLGRAALGMGLIAVGAGLRPEDLVRLRFALWLPVVLKLAVYPVVLGGIALAIGIGGQDLVFLVLCAAMPTAMNGFLLARQMGGDAELYAAVTTLQTIVSFFSIPLVLMAVAQFASG